MRDCLGSPAALLAATLLVTGACGGATTPGSQTPVTSSYDDPYGTTPTASEPVPPPAPGPAAPPDVARKAPAAAPVGPARERAAQLREAADLLDKAEAARERDAKSFAEQLFSSAELIVG